MRPECFGDEWADRMEQPGYRIERREEYLSLSGVVLDGGLDRLEVSVAEISPYEVVQNVGTCAEVIPVNRIVECQSRLRDS